MQWCAKKREDKYGTHFIERKRSNRKKTASGLVDIVASHA